MKFDGCKVTPVIFNTLKNLHRFFDEKGEGFTKMGPTTCINDYSTRPLSIEADAEVWIKLK